MICLALRTLFGWRAKYPQQAVHNAGIFEYSVTRLLMKPAVVAGVDALSENFRLIELRGDTMKTAAWAPGNKVQVKVDAGWVTRTYTPIEWDRIAGATRILVYCIGEGPGSRWARNAVQGDSPLLMGPCRSLNLKTPAATTVVFGDETSFGLAVALARHANTQVHCLFEVNSLRESRRVLDAIDAPPSTLIARLPGDYHLPDLVEAATRLRADATYVLSGKARSIQYLGRALKHYGRRQVRTKVYWSLGKNLSNR